MQIIAGLIEHRLSDELSSQPLLVNTISFVVRTLNSYFGTQVRVTRLNIWFHFPLLYFLFSFKHSVPNSYFGSTIDLIPTFDKIVAAMDRSCTLYGSTNSEKHPSL